MRVSIQKIFMIFRVLGQIWPLYRAMKIEMEEEVLKRR